MALAILELQAVDAGMARFRIDTGSNPYYQLKLGHGRTQRLDMDWVDDAYMSTPLARNPAAGNLVDSRTQATVQLPPTGRRQAYVQLYTYKTADGKSPGFSEVLPIGDAAWLPDPPTEYATPRSMTLAMTLMQTQPRVVPCRTGRQALAQQQSLEGLLGEIAKVAVPVVAGLLKGAATPAPPPVPAVPGVAAALPGAAPPAAPTPSAAGGSGDELLGLLGSLFTQLVGSAAGTSQSQSTWRGGAAGNRFSGAQSAELSHAFIAPALLAFLGPLLDGIVKVLPGVIGPIAQNAPAFMGQLNQHLPMLLNALNQKQLQTQAADNKLATDTLGQLNQRLIAQDFLRAQQSAPTGSTVDPSALMQFLQMLQQASPPPAAPDLTATVPPVSPVSPATTPPQAPTAPLTPAVAKSLALPSKRAVLTFTEGPTQTWNGKPCVLYARSKGLQLRLRLSVAPPAPTAPLAKAILKVVLKDSADQRRVLEKTLQLKNVLANSELPVPFAAEELAKLTTERPLCAYAELRWLTGTGGTGGGQSAAVGACTFTLVDTCFLQQQGAAVSPEREPRDMNLYRSFWNKLWESPVIDEAGSRRERPSQVLWDLDVNAKVAVLLSAEHDGNGVMETRLLKEKVDPEDISQRTQGRLKGGMELSITALAQLLHLWDGAAVPSSEQIQALRVQPLVSANTSELIYNVKLHGKAGQRGLVWVLPVFRLFEFTLGRVRDTDENGCVTAASVETVRYPLPVAARLIGVKSEH